MDVKNIELITLLKENKTQISGISKGVTASLVCNYIVHKLGQYFKIMRFGIVGVKVWFQIKNKKPYLYKFVFLFLLMALQILTEISINPKISKSFRIMHTQKKVNICLVLKRTNIFKRPNWSYMKYRYSTRRPSDVGKWEQGTPFSSQTTSPHGIQHLTQIDEALTTNPHARQSNNALTSKANAHEIDPTVSETNLLSNTNKYDGSPGKQYISWKDWLTQITYDDVKKYLKKIRAATEQEHAEFEKALKGKGNSVYKSPKEVLDAIDRFYDGQNENQKKTQNKEKNKTNDNNKHDE